MVRAKEGKPRNPNPPYSGQSVSSAYLHFFHTTLTYRHFMMKAWNLASQSTRLMIMENAFTYLGSWWCQTCRKIRNLEEKVSWPNRDLNPGALKWKSDALWPTPAMANPNRLEGHIFEKSPFWGPKFGLFLKFLSILLQNSVFQIQQNCRIGELQEPHAVRGPRVGHGWPTPWGPLNNQQTLTFFKLLSQNFKLGNQDLKFTKFHYPVFDIFQYKF
jgi:hypothetical protein